MNITYVFMHVYIGDFWFNNIIKNIIKKQLLFLFSFFYFIFLNKKRKNNLNK